MKDLILHLIIVILYSICSNKKKDDHFFMYQKIINSINYNSFLILPNTILIGNIFLANQLVN